MILNDTRDRQLIHLFDSAGSSKGIDGDDTSAQMRAERSQHPFRYSSSGDCRAELGAPEGMLNFIQNLRITVVITGVLEIALINKVFYYHLAFL